MSSALHKGHRYATVIMDAERTCVLWVGQFGNSRAAIRPFFEQPGERCQQIEAVAMDMNTAFDLEVKQHCRRRRWSTTCSTWWLAMAERWWTGCEWSRRMH